MCLLDAYEVHMDLTLGIYENNSFCCLNRMENSILKQVLFHQSHVFTVFHVKEKQRFNLFYTTKKSFSKNKHSAQKSITRCIIKII